LERFEENEDLRQKVSSIAARVPRFLEEKVNIQDIHSLIINLFDYLLYDLFVVIFEQYWSLVGMVIRDCEAEEPGHRDREVVVDAVPMNLELCDPVLGQSLFLVS
jgi:hypothetical protein